MVSPDASEARAEAADSNYSQTGAFRAPVDTREFRMVFRDHLVWCHAIVRTTITT